MSELILHTTEGGRSQINLRAEQQTVWLTQLDMAELFDATKQNAHRAGCRCILRMKA